MKIPTGIAVGLLALCSMFTLQARADETDRATRLTFREPVQIPGNKVLAAGTYWFLLANPDEGGKVVQIFDESRTAVLASLLTIAADRPQESKDTELVFAKPSGNGLITLLRWFYPTELSGHEFVYDKYEEKLVTHEPELTVMAVPAKSITGD